MQTNGFYWYTDNKPKKVDSFWGQFWTNCKKVNRKLCALQWLCLLSKWKVNVPWIKLHTLTHLESLTCGIDHRNEHGLGNTFKYIVIKSSIWFHKWQKWLSHVMVAVINFPWENHFSLIIISKINVLVTNGKILFSWRSNTWEMKLYVPLSRS